MAIATTTQQSCWPSFFPDIKVSRILHVPQIQFNVPAHRYITPWFCAPRYGSVPLADFPLCQTVQCNRDSCNGPQTLRSDNVLPVYTDSGRWTYFSWPCWPRQHTCGGRSWRLPHSGRSIYCYSRWLAGKTGVLIKFTPPGPLKGRPQSYFSMAVLSYTVPTGGCWIREPYLFLAMIGIISWITTQSRWSAGKLLKPSRTAILSKAPLLKLASPTCSVTVYFTSISCLARNAEIDGRKISCCSFCCSVSVWY